jgi:hypothetical protein
MTQGDRKHDGIFYGWWIVAPGFIISLYAAGSVN